MNEDKIRKIVKEELNKILVEHAKKGDRVRTPHGDGEVLAVIANYVRVRLNSGAVVKVHRDRAVVIN